MYLVSSNFLFIIIFLPQTAEHRAVPAAAGGAARVSSAPLVKTCWCRDRSSMHVKIHTYTYAYTRIYVRGPV